MTHDEMIAVIEAHRDGKLVQYRYASSALRRDERWFDVSGSQTFNFQNHEYRVKPEPMEWWLVHADKNVSAGTFRFFDRKTAEEVCELNNKMNGDYRVSHVREVLCD